MSCCEVPMEIPCTKRAAEGKRQSESRKQILSSHEALQRLDKSFGDRRFDIAALRRRIHPRRGKGKSPGNEFTVFSNQPNRGWEGEHRNGACKNREADGTGNPQLGGNSRPLYRLNRSDVVALSFTLSPELDQTLTIQPDGYITPKDARPVHAQGLTLEEFCEAVRKAYAGYLHDPQVAVALKEFEHPYFVAGGEVGKPGKYELRADTTVIEAVEIAGGLRIKRGGRLRGCGGAARPP